MAYNYEYPYTDPHRENSDWILNTVKYVWEHYKDLVDWQTDHEKEYKELKALYDDIINGEYPSTMEYNLIKWIQKNAIDIIGKIVTNVFFGLTDSGYFVAYIPESWSDIIFNTSGLDTMIPDVNYGHLILSY